MKGVQRRKCNRCRVWKGLRSFSRNTTKDGGYQGECKQCRRSIERQSKASEYERRHVEPSIEDLLYEEALQDASELLQEQRDAYGDKTGPLEPERKVKDRFASGVVSW